MDLRHLRYFVAVAKERNFSRAAETLNIAQPPLSRQIRQLEEEIGADLFDRTTRPLRLTEAGRLLYQHAIQAIAGFDQVRTMMTRYGGAAARHFIIGFVGSVLYGHLPQVLRQFRHETSGAAEVTLIEMSSLDQVVALREGRIDAGFGRLRVDDDAVRRILLAEEPLVAALPDDHPLAALTAPLTLDRIAGESILLYPRPSRPSYADQVLSLFQDHGLTPASRQDVRELQTALGMVAAGAGIAIVPASAQSLHRPDLVFRPIAATDAVSPIILNHRSNDHSPELDLLTAISRRIYATPEG
ncbi:MAG: LysR family transcriptional regulator [Novosphingobium sp.]|nr:LysR family transcriptional regulator [Novosphingobium sp.]